MHRWIILSLALVSACVACHSPPDNAPPTPSREAAAAADIEAKTVALVNVNDLGEGHAYCSAVWVGNDAILTAAHCVEGVNIGQGVSYLTRGDLDANAGDEIQAARLAVLFALDEVNDLALLRAPLSPAHGVARVADQGPYMGERVQGIGHPFSLWYTYATGVVSALRKLDETWMVQTTTPTSPGNSGGGLFDEGGRLLGICHAQFSRGQNLNLYVHVQYVRAFLQAHT
jgi:serine protease Do